ncbi:MAG: glutathione S-transferase N-terminal domain-containing protein [Baekduia sp.]
MDLYTCMFKTSGPASLHACAKAGKALDEAGHSYELKPVKGGRSMPWTLKKHRGEVEKLSGQKLVPILVLDDGEVIVSSQKIADWARENPAS